jgi:hypothetical protein
VDKLTEYGDNLPDALDQRFDEFRREMHQKVQEDKFVRKHFSTKL